MSDVVDFVLLRIQNELEKYKKSKTIPFDLLNKLKFVQFFQYLRQF